MIYFTITTFIILYLLYDYELHVSVIAFSSERLIFIVLLNNFIIKAD